MFWRKWFLKVFLKETRDCYCDRKCKDMGDCCDDILETCPSYFRPGEVKQVEFSTGNVKYFYGGSGLNNEDAFKRHVHNILYFCNKCLFILE